MNIVLGNDQRVVNIPGIARYIRDYSVSKS